MTKEKTISKAEAKFLRDVGRKLQLIRKSRGLSQEEFAKLLNLSREGYSNYEHGKRSMSIVVAHDCLQKFHVNLLTPDIEQLHSMPLPTEEAPIPSRLAWLDTLSSLRARLIKAREAFDAQHYSASRLRLHSMRDAVFTGAAATLWLRLTIPEFGWHGIGSETNIDWALLTSFGLACVLLPFQGLYIGRFVRWARAS